MIAFFSTYVNFSDDVLKKLLKCHVQTAQDGVKIILRKPWSHYLLRQFKLAKKQHWSIHKITSVSATYHIQLLNVST